MEEIHYNNFLIFDKEYIIKFKDFEDTISLQDQGKCIPDLDKNHRDYYFFIAIPQQDYSFRKKINGKKIILDLVKNEKYIFHLYKKSLKKALQDCKVKPSDLSKDIVIKFERITKKYLKIWSIKNV